MRGGGKREWFVKNSAQPARGPYIMHINQLELKDILIGDVWICSGQSNMVHQLELHKERYAAEITSANYPQIRQFNVTNGYWKPAVAPSVNSFSAVAYFFARKIF